MNFAEWFEAQAGPRNYIPGDDDELKSRVYRGEVAKEELERRKEWDCARKFALYAWTYRDLPK